MVWGKLPDWLLLGLWFWFGLAGVWVWWLGGGFGFGCCGGLVLDLSC